MAERIKLLFLCTGNSCRSQMAEGLCRHLKGDLIDVYSAGIEKHGLNLMAVAAMQAMGIDISHQQSKTLDDLGEIDFDYVVTLCGHAEANCPVFTGNCKLAHVGFDDPPALAKDAASEAEAMIHYVRVRNEIAEFVASLPEEFAKMPGL